MLGSKGPRTYLVAFQNPAEVRATGGIFGTFAVVRADQGKVTVVDQNPTRTMGYFDPPIVDLPANERVLYGNQLAQYPADVNLTPDFPTAAKLYMRMYELRTGTTVDGVLADRSGGALVCAEGHAADRRRRRDDHHRGHPRVDAAVDGVRAL